MIKLETAHIEEVRGIRDRDIAGRIWKKTDDVWWIAESGLPRGPIG